MTMRGICISIIAFLAAIPVLAQESPKDKFSAGKRISAKVISSIGYKLWQE